MDWTRCEVILNGEEERGLAAFVLNPIYRLDGRLGDHPRNPIHVRDELHLTLIVDKDHDRLEWARIPAIGSTVDVAVIDRDPETDIVESVSFHGRITAIAACAGFPNKVEVDAVGVGHHKCGGKPLLPEPIEVVAGK